MPIFQSNELFGGQVYYFCGNLKDWNSLILKNSLESEDVFVCDSCRDNKYPEHVKVVKSIKTARRFLLNSGFSNSIIFINAENLYNFSPNPFGNPTNYIIIRISIKKLIHLLNKGILEMSSRRNIQNFKLYI